MSDKHPPFSSIKFCAKCDHYRVGFSNDCLHPKNLDRVDNSPMYSPSFLRSVELTLSGNTCGADAKWFVPKKSETTQLSFFKKAMKWLFEK